MIYQPVSLEGMRFWVWEGDWHTLYASRQAWRSRPLLPTGMGIDFKDIVNSQLDFDFNS